MCIVYTQIRSCVFLCDVLLSLCTLFVTLQYKSCVCMYWFCTFCSEFLIFFFERDSFEGWCPGFCVCVSVSESSLGGEGVYVCPVYRACVACFSVCRAVVIRVLEQIIT